VRREPGTVIATHSGYDDILTGEAEMCRHFMACRAVAKQLSVAELKLEVRV
jgi:hypothetical protein